MSLFHDQPFAPTYDPSDDSVGGVVVIDEVEFTLKQHPQLSDLVAEFIRAGRG